MAEAGEEFIIGNEISYMYNSRHLGGGIYCWVKLSTQYHVREVGGVIYCWIKVKFSIPCQRGWGVIYCWVKLSTQYHVGEVGD